MHRGTSVRLRAQCEVVQVQGALRFESTMQLSPEIPSGKHTKNHGKSPFFMGKSTISMAIFHSFLLVYQRVNRFTTQFSHGFPPQDGETNHDGHDLDLGGWLTEDKINSPRK